MALKDLVSDLSNFKGQSQYDKLDSQIEGGVDFFDDTEGSHIGFRTKTSLESAYHQYQRAKGASIPKLNEETPESGIIAAPNAGVRTNIKMRRAYDMYGEPGNPGLSEPHSHIFSSDNILGVKLQPQFTSDFMTTPLAEYNSKYSLQDQVGAGSKTMSVPKEAFRISKTEPMNDTFQSSFSVNTMKKEYSDSSYIEDLFEFKLGTFKNVPAGINDKGKLKTKSFREVADPNNFDLFRQPFILRETGNQWGMDKVETDNPIGALVGGAVNIADNILGGFFRGAPTFTGLLSRSITDKFRIGKFLLTTQGLGFLGKQVALQGLNPTIESKFYNPLSALSISGANTLIDAVNSGASGNSPLELGRALGQAIVSAFIPIGHPQRHIGGDAARYENMVTLTSEDGRLAYQAKAFSFTTGVVDSLPDANLKTGIGFLDNYVNNAINDAVDSITLTADAALKSPIFALSNPNKYAFPISSAPKAITNGVPTFIGGPDLALNDVTKAIDKKGKTFNKETKDGDEISGGSGNNLIKRHSTLSYEGLKASNSYGINLMSPSEMNDKNFRENASTSVDLRNMAVRVAGAFGKKEPGEAIVNERFEGYKINEGIGDVKGFHKVKLNSVLGNIKGEMRSTNVDKVNIHPYGSEDLPENTKDFIKFRFKDVINNKFLVFRAILEAITDTVTPEYAEDRYIGRPDKLFVYQGVDRNVSFTFSLYPKTKQELPILMEKLNYLVGLCYPSYTEAERMVSPFIELTMGDMFVDTPGILSSLTVTVEENTTWEIQDKLQFPHFIKAACEFRHIGNYIPSMKGKHYDLDWVESDGFYNEAEGSPTTNLFTDKDELGFPLYPDRSKKWIDNVFAQLNQGERGSKQ